MPAQFPAELSAYLHTLEQWCDDDLARIQAAESLPNPLYHYTTSTGLRGILETKALWFTDFRHLNDPTELHHGIEVLSDMTRLLPTGDNAAARRFLDLLAEVLREPIAADTLQFLIASFSKNRDRLSQWRAYADDGRGFAIGFGPRVFRLTDPLPEHPNFYVGEVTYGIEATRKAHLPPVEKAQEIFLTAVEKYPSILASEDVAHAFAFAIARAIVASHLAWNSLTAKDAAYADEEEVRLAISGPRGKLQPHVKTRLRGGEIVPYIARTLDTDLRAEGAIAEIVIGPAAHPDSERGLRTMLREFGYSDSVAISRSDIPYRSGRSP